VVDPHITAAAADAAITALCDENLFPRDIFDVEEDNASSASSLISCSARYLYLKSISCYFVYLSNFARWYVTLKFGLPFIKSLLLSVSEPSMVKI
jgi:hypothetical protein